MTYTNIKYLAYTLTLGLFISCSSDDANENPANSIYIDIPDANFESKLISLGIDSDQEINRKMLRTDAEKVTSLDISSQHAGDEIEDLTGIEGFINLTKLEAVMNSLSQIDLSANKALDSIYLAGNRIENIDISNNTKLKMLNVDANILTSITGIADAKQLKTLSASFNFLEAIDLDSESLETLYIETNDLKSLNTEKAVNLKTLFARNNQITSSIDLTNNKQLEVVTLTNNRLDELNLGQHANLKSLYISENSLSQLDVSGLSALIDLRIRDNSDLLCVQINDGQNIPTVHKSNYQNLNTDCN